MRGGWGEVGEGKRKKEGGGKEGGGEEEGGMQRER